MASHFAIDQLMKKIKNKPQSLWHQLFPNITTLTKNDVSFFDKFVMWKFNSDYGTYRFSEYFGISEVPMNHLNTPLMTIQKNSGGSGIADGGGPGIADGSEYRISNDKDSSHVQQNKLFSFREGLESQNFYSGFWVRESDASKVYENIIGFKINNLNLGADFYSWSELLKANLMDKVTKIKTSSNFKSLLLERFQVQSNKDQKSDSLLNKSLNIIYDHCEIDFSKKEKEDLILIKLKINNLEQIYFQLNENGHLVNTKESQPYYTSRFKVFTKNSITHQVSDTPYIININGLFFYDLNDIPIDVQINQGERLNMNQALEQIKNAPPVITIRSLNNNSELKSCSFRFACKLNIR